MKQTRKRNHGFTLAELLVASILMSIVMTAVYTLFHSAVGSWRAVEAEFDMYQDARNALTIFNRELDNLVWQAGHLFEGEDDEITMFIAAEPMDVEESEGRHLIRVRYYYNRAKKALMREEALVKTALPKRPPRGRELDRTRIKLSKEEKFLVASNVAEFKVRYIWTPLPLFRDPKMPPKPTEFITVDRHKERWGLPQGIEIRLVVSDPEDQSKRLAVSLKMPIRTLSFLQPKRNLLFMLGDAV